MIHDVLIIMISTSIVLIITKGININFFAFSRIEIFIILVCIGIFVLLVNSLVARDIRKMILSRIIK